MFGVLLWSAWRRHRVLRWSLAVGLFLMGLLLAGTYQAFGTGFLPGGFFEDSSLTSMFDAFSGSSVNILTPEGWLGFGYVHPFTLTLLIAWTVAGAATAIAREVEDGTIEFLASRPVDRRVILGARILAWNFGMVALLAATYLGTATGIVFFDALADFPLGQALLFPLSLAPMLVLIGGVAFLASAASSTRSRVYGVTVGFAVASYFLNFASSLWDPLEPFAPLSPFHYVSPGEWALEGVQWGPAIVMVVIGLILMGIAMVVVDRRDFAA
ncbi:MAG: ABC transporter permease subunit [Actinomycetota bacterium]